MSRKGKIVARVKCPEYECPPRIINPVQIGDIVLVQRKKNLANNVPEKFSGVDQLNYDTYAGVVVKVYDEGRKFYLKSVDGDFITRDPDKPAWSRYGDGLYVDSRREDMYKSILVVDRAVVLTYRSDTLRTIDYEELSPNRYKNSRTYTTQESAIILKIDSPIYFSDSMTYAIHNDYGAGTQGTNHQSFVKAMNLVRIKYLQSLV